MKVTFRATVIPSGNASGVEVPLEAKAQLGPEARPLVVVAINGHTWRSRVALMRGQRLIGISAAHRRAAGISEGDLVEVSLERDDAPRDVEAPADLAGAMAASPGTKARFDALPFGLKRKHVLSVESAKSAEVRQRRIEALIKTLQS